MVLEGAVQPSSNSSLHHWHRVAVRLISCATLKSGQTEGLIQGFLLTLLLRVQSLVSLHYFGLCCKEYGYNSVVEDVFSNVLVQPRPLK